MRFSTTFAALAGASAAMAQLPISLPNQIFGLNFSASCQQATLQVLTNSSFAQCFHANDLLPIITTNGSIVPILDQFMTDLCYTSPCTNATLNMAAQTILSGCAADLASEGLSNSTVTTAFSAYPIVREVLCLKTSTPYDAAKYGGFLGPPPIPISSAYNMTNGTFCVSSVLTQLSAYFGANLTLPYIVGAVSGANSTAAQLATSINPNVLCNECIFGAVDVIETAIPAAGNIPLATVTGLLGMSDNDYDGATINSVLNSTCAYKPLSVTPGRLPPNITVSILNSTFPYTFPSA